MAAPPYSPALGCEAGLDDWCRRHCEGTETLRARQPSASVGGALFSCFREAEFRQLDRVTTNISRLPPKSCGRKSSEYVHHLKMTKEQLGLLHALHTCLNRTQHEASTAWIATRRETLSYLRQPMLRSNQSGATSPRHAVDEAAAESWLRHRRPHLHAAQHCLERGRGTWRSVVSDGAEEPYLLAPDFLPKANLSKWWWGACDDDLRRGMVRPPRAAVLQTWEPDGEGCDDLKKGRKRLPSLKVLAKAFCQRRAGRSVLFVGDSVQGQFFVSFAMALGVYSSEPQLNRTRIPTCAKDAKYLASLATVHEFHMDMQLCAPGPQGIRARFIRNEMLSLSVVPPADTKHLASGHAGRRSPPPDPAAGSGAPEETDPPPPPHLPRSFILCDWATVAAETDYVVLNRGMHYMPDDTVVPQLSQTFSHLQAQVPSPRSRPHLSHAAIGAEGSTSSYIRTSAMGGGADGRNFRVGGVPSPRVVYRGTHAPIPSCHILDDPLPRPFPYSFAAAHDDVVKGFNWANFEQQNEKVAKVAAAFNITYLDVHYATSLRPGGHMPSRKTAAGDCAHYCIPGPIDEWSRLLLALWT